MSTSSAGTLTFRFVPSPNNHVRFINCNIIGPNNRVLYTITSNDPHVTIMRDCQKDVAIIEWRSPFTMIEIRGGKKMRKEDFLRQIVGKTSAQCMYWHNIPYYWTADDAHFYLYSENISSLPLAIVRASDPLFEMEVSPEAVQTGVLEPALVALIVMQWSRGVMWH